MPDPAEQLQRLYMAGFELQTFERYPSAVGVVRGEFLVLLQPSPQGLFMLGLPGRRVGESDNLAVLVERDGRQVFQFKSEIIPASEADLTGLRQFRTDVEAILRVSRA